MQQSVSVIIKTFNERCSTLCVSETSLCLCLFASSFRCVSWPCVLCGTACWVCLCFPTEVSVSRGFERIHAKPGPCLSSVCFALQEKVTELPSCLKGGTLRSYQMEGLNWLVSLHNNGLNGILVRLLGQQISFCLCRNLYKVFVSLLFIEKEFLYLLRRLCCLPLVSLRAGGLYGFG